MSSCLLNQNKIKKKIKKSKNQKIKKSKNQKIKKIKIKIGPSGP